MHAWPTTLNSEWLIEKEAEVGLLLHVQPGAKKTELTGLYDGRLKIRVAAPPVDGAANQEIIRYLSKLLVIRRNQVRIRTGETGRHKLLTIDGLTAQDVRAKILSLLGQ